MRAHSRFAGTVWRKSLIAAGGERKTPLGLSTADCDNTGSPWSGNHKLQIERIELIELRMPLVHFFETSFGRTTERRILLVHVFDRDGAEGWGECTAGEGPFYSEEWTDSAWAVLREWLAPMVVGREVAGAAEVEVLMAVVRGNRMAKAAVETACWDLEARRLGVPLWRHLGGTQTEIPCGVSIGIQDSVDELFEKIRAELAAGYQRIKIKIKPGWDVSVVEQVRAAFPDIQLMADANSAYTKADFPVFQQLDEFNLMMIEQPLAHDDIADHALLQEKIKTPICLDESIHHYRDANLALAIGACGVINIKLGRVGGYAEAKRVEEVARINGVPVWCGGMLESGIGRAHNIALSTLAGFSLPGDVSASSRYWHQDIVDPPVTVTRNGTIVVPEGRGIGVEVDRKRIDGLAVRMETIV
jgi:O-succinylbenzoate synthase